jgi:hypothetical protein
MAQRPASRVDRPHLRSVSKPGERFDLAIDLFDRIGIIQTARV